MARLAQNPSGNTFWSVQAPSRRMTVWWSEWKRQHPQRKCPTCLSTWGSVSQERDLWSEESPVSSHPSSFLFGLRNNMYQVSRLPWLRTFVNICRVPLRDVLRFIHLTCSASEAASAIFRQWVSCHQRVSGHVMAYLAAHLGSSALGRVYGQHSSSAMQSRLVKPDRLWMKLLNPKMFPKFQVPFKYHFFILFSWETEHWTVACTMVRGTGLHQRRWWASRGISGR